MKTVKQAAAVSLVSLAFSLIVAADTIPKPAQAPQTIIGDPIVLAATPVDPATGEPIGPPNGMTQAEWNMTAVKELVPKGHSPKPAESELRGIYWEASGVESVQDDPNTVRVYPVSALVNHATVIQVPGTVLKAWCGDLQGWTLEGENNYVSVKPLAGELSTNLHVLTVNGRMYNFRLFSASNGSYTDVFQVKSNSGYTVNADRLLEERTAAIRKQLDAEYSQKQKEQMAQAQDKWVRDYASKTFFDYGVDQGRAFKVQGVFNDQAFTYFRVAGDEKPTIFLETKTGRKWSRELLDFNVTGNDFYRVQKLLEPNQRFVLKLRTEEVKISRKGI